MDRRALKAELKRQKAELRRRRDAARAQLVARRRALVGDRDEERRRRRRRIIFWLLLLLLILLLLSRCDCDEAPLTLPVPGPDAGAGVAPPIPVKLTPAPPPKPSRRRVRKKKHRIKSDERPDYITKPPGPPKWLSRFRLQVAARSPRLAACFEGVSAPGALKWTARVNASTGVASDHVLEPMLGGESLSKTQRKCLVGVLSSPRYTLPEGASSRVSIVIEF
ncbi:MAG: hypothetical protein ACE366_03840 [Bradymonadia bacterium]